MNRARARFAGAVAVAGTLFVSACSGWQWAPVAQPLAEPLKYAAPYATTPPAGAGDAGANVLEQGAWAKAPWTADFVDIEGPRKPTPPYRTRAKVMWDDRCLYLGAELSDPHVWGTLRQNDQIVFQDNDFEAFIDPDGDGNEYYEIEINALGTVFDLFLHRSYRNGGPAVHGWNADGIVRGIAVDGTLNDPKDVDRRWVVTMAIPWTAFAPPKDPGIEALPADQRGFGESARARSAPKAGDTWRINFSRVQWRNNHEPAPQQRPRSFDAYSTAAAMRQDGAFNMYAKQANLPEDNWVWSPQWAIDMHLPQYWGRVTFVK